MKYICSKCAKEADVTIREPKCSCGGLWKLSFEPPAFSKELIDQSVWGMFRYRKFMALTDDSWRSITMGEGMTPIISLDQDVSLKMDYYMPTLSFKDRGAAVLISHCKSIGVDAVVQDSSGNAGNSVAAYCARAGISCEIYVPEQTSPQKIRMIQAHGAKVHIIEGSRDHCADVCRERVERERLFYANHVYNPFFYEGTKTYLYEIYEQLGRIPETLFLPVGNGTLFLGVVKALEEFLKAGILSKMPRVFVVQSEHCAPLYLANQKGLFAPAKITPQPTQAEGIAIGKPMRGEEILKLIYRYHFPVVTAPEAMISEARKRLAERGIYCEHTTAANYAAYLSACRQYGRLPDSLIPMCGAGLKSDHA